MKFSLHLLGALGIMLTAAVINGANHVNAAPNGALAAVTAAAATATALKDAKATTAEQNSKTTAAMSPELLAGCIKYGLPTNIPFERATAPRNGLNCFEGYWYAPNDGSRYYPHPIAHTEPWPGKDEWLKKLLAVEQAIEKLEENTNSSQKQKEQKQRFGCDGATQRGYAPSRLEFFTNRLGQRQGVNVGCGEYTDNAYQWFNNPTAQKRFMIWPQGYSTHYIGRHNVIPSIQFYHYIENHPLLPQNS